MLVYSRNRTCQKKRVVMAARRKEEGGTRLRLTARGEEVPWGKEEGKAKRRGAMGEGGGVRKRRNRGATRKVEGRKGDRESRRGEGRGWGDE